LKKSKKNLLLLSFLYILGCFSLNASEFAVMDLDLLLRQHPLFAEFDFETGRFKNTPSEIIPEDKLKNQISILADEIAMLEEQKLLLVKNKIVEFFDKNMEEENWKKIAEIDKKLINCRDELLKKHELLKIGGVPGISHLYEVLSGIYKDIVKQHFVSSETVYLNRLPVVAGPFPDLIRTKTGLFNFFYKRDEESLVEYLRYNYEIGMLIKSGSDSIIYQKEFK